jgi:hypothetical protein
MRLRVLFFLLPILTGVYSENAFAQANSKLDQYIQIFASTGGQPVASMPALTGFVNKLEQKRNTTKNDRLFLQNLFVKTHQQFLKKYEQYASFDKLVNDKEYNCLTGIALYALLLDHFGYQYQIIETNYHIFLIASTDEGKILFEATDPVNGFITGTQEIEARINTYRKNIIRDTRSDKTYYHFTFELYNQVTLDQLAGLMFYNRAIQSYNAHELQHSVKYLSQAIAIYPSPRIEEFSKLVLLSVLESPLDYSVKEKCVREIQSVRKKLMPAIASADSY